MIMTSKAETIKNDSRGGMYQGRAEEEQLGKQLLSWFMTSSEQAG